MAEGGERRSRSGSRSASGSRSRSTSRSRSRSSSVSANEEEQQALEQARLAAIEAARIQKQREHAVALESAVQGFQSKLKTTHQVLQGKEPTQSAQTLTSPGASVQPGLSKSITSAPTEQLLVAQQAGPQFAGLLPPAAPGGRPQAYYERSQSYSDGRRHGHSHRRGREDRSRSRDRASSRHASARPSSKGPLAPPPDLLTEINKLLSNQTEALHSNLSQSISDLRVFFTS